MGFITTKENKRMKEAAFGVVILGQCCLASSLKETAEMMLGPQKHIYAVDIAPHFSQNEAMMAMQTALDALQSYPFTIILVDIFGATPCNIAMQFFKRHHIEILAGMNLPMLVKLIEMRNSNDIITLLDEAQNAGHRYLVSCADMVSSRPSIMQ